MLERTAGDDATALVSVVARNIRELRDRAGLSLSELAVAAGVAKSTLSQLESGRGNPSIETLWAVARALGVPFGRLVEPPHPDIRVVRAGQGVRIDAAGAPFHAELLASKARRGSFEVYVLEAEPGNTRAAEPHTAGTVEHLYVFAGRMRSGPADTPVELGPGDLATFPGDVAHVYAALEPGTQALLIMDYA
ncbi:MAG TPA: XRE family transcriptional regulator [Egibacteraceae bacterium]